MYKIYYYLLLTDLVPSCNKSPRRSAKSVNDGLVIGFIFQQSNIILYLTIKINKLTLKYYDHRQH